MLTPTLTLSDNGDGTGATATIAGSSPGSTNTVYTAPWSGGIGGAEWTNQGSRVGDGMLSLAIESGAYWAYVQSTLAGESVVSTLVGVSATAGGESVWERCLTAVAAKLQALSLAGIASSSIVVRKLPWNRNQIMPGLFVTPTQETLSPATNLRDDVGYGVQLTLVRPSNQDLSADLSTELAWREQVSRAFRESALADVDEVFTVRIEPGPIIDPASFAAQYDVQTLVVRCVAREARGV